MSAYESQPDLVYWLKKLERRVSAQERPRGMRHAAVASEETTTSTSFTDLATVGPSITLDVPASGFVELFVAVTLKTSHDTFTATVGLLEPTDIPAAVTVTERTGNVYTVMYSRSAESIGAWAVVPATAGERTYTLKYKVSGGTGSFKDRKLWGRVV